MKAAPSYRDHVVGVETPIPLMNGRIAKAINFDNAATTPPFISVIQAIVNFSPWYSSIHRGTGCKSQFSSKLYEEAREEIAEFVRATGSSQTVIFVKNATEAINKLAYRLCDSQDHGVVLSSCMEHHSNDLPWREKYTVDYIDIDEQGRLSLRDLAAKLEQYQGRVKLVTVTGASNVTGYRNPIHQVAAMTHNYGAKILVDGAQLVPHTPFDMKPVSSPEHIDFLVFSAHKMYAPFGIGVLIGPKSAFEESCPDYKGGGTVDLVTHDFVRWAPPPQKEEAGTPNLMGVVALKESIRTLSSFGMDKIDRYETFLLYYALEKLRRIPDIELIGSHEHQNRVAIIPFNISGMPHGTTAAILSYEGGIAVRSGCFCAQPYVQRLLKIPPEEIHERIKDPHVPHPGLVRISFGLYNTREEIDTLAALLQHIVLHKKAYLDKYQAISPPIH
ncbi:aminotransferase class V-fold PLP-dependent enzyme [Geosporobacter ferrireducens]|uniref:aminotransferase class V-fold PLP-dependent enzyme n=1 Tax=Geosporobacter ferrireducens TaxID=1424294 RepID=UPI00139AD2E7|nr:aminotransferase class V-fold PLP-dependent enzyme [Geosporobacter ferrireducens]MTI53512.1 aminotransferase class V-fold PLP-dependent enzyme [Geosporobacter ferrireducens]